MKNETKQTAVDWLINIVIKSIKNLSEDECEYLSEIIEQAKQIEKQQIIDFANNYGFDICGDTNFL
jgi:hypothetical protein